MNGIVDIVNNKRDFRVLMDIVCPSCPRDISPAQFDGAALLVYGKPGRYDAWFSLGVDGRDAAEPLRREIGKLFRCEACACHLGSAFPESSR